MPTILLIDDDITLLSSLGAEFETAGYHILRSSRLDQAARMVATETIDIVLLEVDTEHGRGWELLRELVAVRGLPVLVVTAHGLEEDVVAALDMGAVDFVTKPFRIGEMQARIRARLRDLDLPTASVQSVVESPVPSRSAPPVVPVPLSDQDDSDDRVFIDHAAERSLLQERMMAEAYPENIEELPPGPRLRAARQRQKVSLVQIELDTKLRIWYLQAMEEDRFGMLPRDGGAEGMVRTYAKYLGLDVTHAAEDFRAEYGEAPVQPLAYLGGKPEPREFPRWLLMTGSALLALILFSGAIFLFAADQVVAFNANMRALVVSSTVTPTPTLTPKPTLTPTRTPSPTATVTPTITPTVTPLPPTPAPVDPAVTTTTVP